MTSAPLGTFTSGQKATYRTDEHDAFVATGPTERTTSIIRAVLGAVLIDGHTAYLIDLPRQGKDVTFAEQHLAGIATDARTARTLIDDLYRELGRRRRETQDTPELYLVILGADSLIPNPAADDDATMADKQAMTVNLGFLGVGGGRHGIHLILSAEIEKHLHRFPGAPFPAITAHMNDTDATIHDGVEDVTFAPLSPDPETLRENLMTFVPPVNRPTHRTDRIPA